MYINDILIKVRDSGLLLSKIPYASYSNCYMYSKKSGW
jgi:hypothetical protein